ncbi:unconventional myosin-IXb isoform X3 [Rhinatrema bivittatum]|uniref:unconventional myosin-IXb isoform X3 n=1 Tax=Rhinatrema bivittatum TaxID=194408 RepID=UPI00112D2405|nr:unconventional myosin-IXb isoform X3 [Rhinatrema bivittatum]
MSVRVPGEAASHEKATYHLHIYPQLSPASTACCRVAATKESTASEVIKDVIGHLSLDGSKCYVLTEVKESGGEEWILDASDSPVQRVLLWPRRGQDEHPQKDGYYFLLQERNSDGTIKYVHMQAVSKEKEARRMVERGFLPRRQEDYDDLCNLPNLTETTLLENLKTRFLKHKIYTYAGSILIAINPFKFLPIYNPKYVKMYENHQLGKLEPHIFAIADVAYHTMLRKHVNQCIVISGESGSGKTQSTNFLIHCLTALSQKGYASGVERTILGAGPVLEAFGNAKTAHNNNSSRFGKFIQVNYLESGVVRGAVVEKYLLEKSRLVSQEKDERNYHVFYYLLLGVTEEERREFQLMQPEDYFYLNQHNFMIEDGEDLRHDFERLKQAMEMVGFLPATKKQIFSVLSAILYLGNVTYKKRATGREEGLEVGPPDVLDTLSQLLQVKREMLVEALTKRKTVTVNERLILPYSLNEAVTARDSMAKSLYSALFDWIVLRINHALLNKKDMEESVTCLSIGVLDIFGFEDFETNSFEQFCINYANEQLQYYFNQHIFKLEQEEYQSEGITWHNIDYTDNVGCIHLISKKPTGLFYLLDEESNFPHATHQTLLAKFKQQHEENKFFVGTPVMEPAFIIWHFAGKVKYQIKDFREKNTDYMRPDIVALLRSSDSAYIRELIGMDPVAVFRWASLRAAIRAMAVLNQAGRERAQKTAGVVRKGPRVPLGELQRANIQAEKVYRRSVLDFSFDCTEDFDIDVFEDIITFYENKKEMHAQIIKSIKGLPWQDEDPGKLLRSLTRLQPSRFQLPKTKGIRQKQTIPKNLLDSKSLKLIVSLTLHDRTTKSLLHLHKKKKPPSISAQFQASLNKLLETLGKAEPFFIRCIRSNSEKMELCFDEALVLQQLRYTGMLETVRIRRSGYSAKYTFQDFMDQFQVLLPKDAKPMKDVISTLLGKMELDKKNYQIGKTKVFMKETERQKLQDTLHKEVIHKIGLLQSWFRMVMERKQFVRMKQAAVTIQACWRSYNVRRMLEEKTSAAVYIQAIWRGYRQQKSYRQQMRRLRSFQALCRGYVQRKRFQQMVQKVEAEKRKMLEAQQKEQEARQRQKAEEERQLTEIARLGGGANNNTGHVRKESPQHETCVAQSERLEKQIPDGERSLLVSQRSWSENAEKAASSREKRESRRQRGLEHNKLQNKHIFSSLDEQQTPSGKDGGDLEKRGELKVAQEHSQLSGEEGSQVSPEGSTEVKKTPPISDISREMPGIKGDHVDSKSESLERKGTTVVQENQRHQEKDSQDDKLPDRPSTLPLNLNNHLSPVMENSGRQPECPEDKSKPSVTQKPPSRDLESPSTSPIQRYNDQERLKNVGEKWKEKRHPDSGQNESAAEIKMNEKPSTGQSARKPSVKNISSLDDIPTTALPTPPNQVSPDGMESEKSSKKQVIQKKKSNEHPPHPDVGAESKPTYKSPLYRLLGKRQEKKYIKEIPHTPEGGENITLMSTVPDTMAAKKMGEAVSGPPSRLQAGEHSLKESSAGKPKRSRSIKISKVTTVSEKWNASMYREITNSNELKHLDDFLFNKINDLRSQKSAIECLFFEATEKFRGNIKAMYSTPNGQIHAGYKDLMENYQLLVNNLAKEREEKDVKLVLNLFQSFLDEFTRGYTKKEDSEFQKSKNQKKKRKQDQIVEQNGHVFLSYQVNIGQSCEQCLSNIWPMEKAFLCSTCKLICHKKCMPKIQSYCITFCGKKNEQNAESRHFGVRLCTLTSDNNAVPIVMEKLLEHVEMHGLYTEGIYRKSGAANRMRELKESLENDPNSVKLENYPIHTITGILKQWLRELPEPLMTFTQYGDFLSAVELPDKREQLCAIYKVLEQLPQANHTTLERLVFHLVKVALIEDVNRMSPNALAIVFAPCLLRCPDNSDPLTSMKDVSKTTTCVEMLIKEQMRKYKIKMDEINQLEAAETIAFRRLSLLRQNTLWPIYLGFSSPFEGMLTKSPKASDNGFPELASVQEEEASSETEADRESELLIERIQSIKEEKEDITYRLPDLDQRGSDEENADSETSASTESLLENRLGQTDSEGSSQGGAQPLIPSFSAPSMNLTGIVCPPASLNQPSVGARRRPSSFLAKMKKVHHRHPLLPTSNIKLPPGIGATDHVWRTSVAEGGGTTVRRREQPARRTDSIQSVYMVPDVNPCRPLGSFEDYEPTAKVKRRFSDPYAQVPSVDESNL